MRIIIGLALVGTAVAAEGAVPPEDADAGAARIRHTIEVLASDDYGGRQPGTPGEEKTVAYLQRQFRQLGLAPGNPDGTYVQAVPMVGIFSTPTTTFTTAAGQTLQPAIINDYIALSHRTVPDVEVKASDVIFCGYGVVAPEYQWDDFKGVDVRGKTIIVLVNDPPVRDPKDPSRLDPNMFKGKAMTYYGRWTYKYEEATERGAAACLIVHETGPAGYPFAVLSGSMSRENFSLQTPDGNAQRVAVEGWLTLAYARKLCAAAGFDYDRLKAAAVSPDFHPVDLRMTADFSVRNRVRALNSRNVIAALPGADPAKAGEYLIYSAHWDHLGRNPALKGDPIYHGAEDNASGCAGLLEIAREFAALTGPDRPKRTVLFFAPTGEEQGLLGAEYYAQHPLYPLVRTLANLNMDVLQQMGPARDVVGVGFGNSTLDDVAVAVLARSGRVLVPEPEPEAGRFYRSDHFEFAKVGVPAFYINEGLDIVGKPAGWGKEQFDAYYAHDYHKVTDVIKPWWDLRGAALDADFLFQMGVAIDQSDVWPQWKPGCEFKARREAMLAAAAR
jgi:Zn-dependent M28 family amino/carboxypeptidase